MTDNSSLDAIKVQMSETKKLQEQSLKKLNAIKSKNGASMQPVEMKEVNKAIKAVERSLKLYTNL